MELYQKFAREVISSFLSEDKRGEFVSLVIDEQFMDNVAVRLSISKQNIIDYLRRELFSTFKYYSVDDSRAISIVAFQLYAASKCVTEDGGYSANAYNPRLYELISTDNQTLQKWYTNYQDTAWAVFYKFCYRKGFVVKQCSPRPYEKGRFVQYPLNLAKHTFNREDLKYISSIFHKNNISAGEDIGYTDFWKLFNIRWSFVNLSNHCTRVLESIYADTGSYDIAKSQIYNHYLVWDGEYKEPYSHRGKVAISLSDKQISISNKSGIYELYVRNIETGTLIEKIAIDRKFQSSLKTHYRNKRDGVIIFQPNSDYPNVWDETRYIEDQSTNGLAIVIGDFYRFRNATQLHNCDNVRLYEFDYNSQTKEFYSEEPKTHELIGGLKVARHTYLECGPPILRLYNNGFYLLNGKVVNQEQGDYLLDLREGEHILKFQRRREVKITITSPRICDTEWSDKYCKWGLNRKEYLWIPRNHSDGIVGLDFSKYSIISNTQPLLKNWIRAQQGETVNNNNNITLKLLNNQNRYE